MALGQALCARKVYSLHFAYAKWFGPAGKSMGLCPLPPDKWGLAPLPPDPVDMWMIGYADRPARYARPVGKPAGQPAADHRYCPQAP